MPNSLILAALGALLLSACAPEAPSPPALPKSEREVLLGLRAQLIERTIIEGRDAMNPSPLLAVLDAEIASASKGGCR